MDAVELSEAEFRQKAHLDDPENLEKRTQRSALPGGLKVALLPRKTRGEYVTARLRLRYGNEESLQGYRTAGNFLGALMLRGTKRHDRQQNREVKTPPPELFEPGFA